MIASARNAAHIFDRTTGKLRQRSCKDDEQDEQAAPGMLCIGSLAIIIVDYLWYEKGAAAAMVIRYRYHYVY